MKFQNLNDEAKPHFGSFHFSAFAFDIDVGCCHISTFYQLL
jgi:hypothetical protein